jgi:hypothetical protein
VRESNPGGSEVCHTRPCRSWGPPSLLYNGYRAFYPEVKRPGRGIDHSFPSNAKVKERVELYLYSTSGPRWPILGRNLLFQGFYWHYNIKRSPTLYCDYVFRSLISRYAFFNYICRYTWDATLYHFHFRLLPLGDCIFCYTWIRHCSRVSCLFRVVTQLHKMNASTEQRGVCHFHPNNSGQSTPYANM